MAERTLKDRVSDRLLELRINPFEAARRARLGREFVNDILTGRKKSVRGDNIAKLALALEVDVEFLLGSRDAEYKAFEFPRATERVEVVGVIMSGIWRVSDRIVGPPAVISNRLAADPRWPAGDQADYLMGDSSGGNVAPAGHHLRCIKIEAWWPQFRQQEYFVIERRRQDLIELTLRRARWNGAGMEYCLLAADSGEEDCVALEPHDKDSDTRSAQKIAVALFSYQVLARE